MRGYRTHNCKLRIGKALDSTWFKSYTQISGRNLLNDRKKIGSKVNMRGRFEGWHVWQASFKKLSIQDAIWSWQAWCNAAEHFPPFGRLSHWKVFRQYHRQRHCKTFIGKLSDSLEEQERERENRALPGPWCGQFITNNNWSVELPVLRMIVSRESVWGRLSI